MPGLLIQNAKILDPGKLKAFEADVLIEDKIIKKIAPAGSLAELPEKTQVIEAKGKYLAPGLIDPHLHIESSMLTPVEFSAQAAACGTTAIFVDPHEIANVRKDGVELFLELAEISPVDMYVGIPSCVPATHLEDAGSEIDLADIERLIEHPRAYGLAEMMNFPGIILNLGTARQKVELAFNRGKIVDGHAPGVSGENLRLYISNGKNDHQVRIMSDHESTTYEEAEEKVDAGMYVALRYGSASKDLDRILPRFIESGHNLDRLMLCSDDLEAEELLRDGHIDRTVRRTREIMVQNAGHDSIKSTLAVLKLAAYNPGRYFDRFFDLYRLPGIGRIEEGFRANLIIIDDLESFHVETTIVGGKIVYSDGKLKINLPEYDYSKFVKTINIGRKMKPEDFRIISSARQVLANVIEVIPDNLLTRKIKLEMKPSNGEIKAQPARNLAKLAVIERHKASGSLAVGLVSGLSLKSGAVASSVAHDSHNIIVAGTDDALMARAVNLLAETGGGMAVVLPESEAIHPLEIAGLMSSKEASEVARSYKQIRQTAQLTGTRLDNIFMTLSFLSLPVIPELKITNRGLVDVNAFDFVQLLEEKG